MTRKDNPSDAIAPPVPFYMRETWLLIALLFFIALLYFRYLPVSYDFDGTVFSQHLRFAMTKGHINDVIHPHHLFYMPFNFYLYKVLQAVTGNTVLEYFHFQVFSLVFGILTLWATFKLLKRFTRPGFFPLAGMVLVAVSYGIWYHAVEANEYLAGLFFVTIGAYILFTKPVNTWYIGVSSLLFSIGADFHLTNGLIVASALMFFFFIHKETRWKNSFKFLGFYFFYLTVPYVIFYWVTGYNIFSLFKKVVAGGRDIFAGYSISYWSKFSLSSLLDSLRSVGENIISVNLPVLEWVSALFLLGVIVTVIIAARKDTDRAPYLKLTCWLLPYMVFFSAWDNRHTGFKLSVTLPLLLMFIYAVYRFYTNFGKEKIKKGQRTLRHPAIVMLPAIAFVFCINFFSAILPTTLIENNRPYELAMEIAKKTPENAVIVISGCGSNVSMYGKIYIPYFGHRRVMVVDWMLGNNHSLSGVYELLFQTKTIQNQPVFILSELTGKTGPVKCLMENHGLSESEYSVFRNRFLSNPQVPLSGKFTLYCL